MNDKDNLFGYSLWGCDTTHIFDPIEELRSTIPARPSACDCRQTLGVPTIALVSR
jgi:hypothetical protein